MFEILTVENWKLFNLFHKFLLDVHGVSLFILQILGWNPTRFFCQMFSDIPPNQENIFKTFLYDSQWWNFEDSSTYQIIVICNQWGQISANLNVITFVFFAFLRLNFQADYQFFSPSFFFWIFRIFLKLTFLLIFVIDISVKTIWNVKKKKTKLVYCETSGFFGLRIIRRYCTFHFHKLFLKGKKIL